MILASIFKMSRGMAAVLFTGLFFSGCTVYKLPRKVNVQIAWSDSIVGGDRQVAWKYTREGLFDMMNEMFKAAFTESGQFAVVDQNPDYIFRVNSVFTTETAKTERLEDPCQKPQGILSTLVFGDRTTYSTFVVHSVGLTVSADFKDVNSQNSYDMYVRSKSSEYITQDASSDSINCNPYRLAGIASKEKVLEDVCSTIRFLSKDQIRKWEKE